MGIAEEVAKKGRLAQTASRILANISSDIKNKALLSMADAVEKNGDRIISSNKKDIVQGKKENLSNALIDRLTLTPKRINAMAQGLREVAEFEDPIGEVLEQIIRPDGLKISKVRVPLGVIGIVYESRPNVTCDAAGLCLKASNAVLLRGGSEAINSNKTIARILIQAACEQGIPEGSIQLIETTDRKAVMEMIKLHDYIDVIIPRGGHKMIHNIVSNATVPVIAHGKGVCHTYVDVHANVKMAQDICYNAKVQCPGVCNAMETLLVHKDIAEEFLPQMVSMFKEAKVQIRGCEKTNKLVQGISLAKLKDWDEEYLDLILSVKIVDSLQDAVDHITVHGTKHSEAIVTEDEKTALQFLRQVDASSVYWNASTRFTDGGEFGMGAEIGISTQKLHARGPMGIKELTSYKYIVYGQGHIR